MEYSAVAMNKERMRRSLFRDRSEDSSTWAESSVDNAFSMPGALQYPLYQRRGVGHQEELNFGQEYQTQFNAKPAFPQRKTLLDTFIDRDDHYWMTRMTLKIDVPYTDHSHIIGRQGRNTQRVMKETGCHIHFPDSNKNQDCDKSNQVSIAGPPANVEHARGRIRALAPLTVAFELKQMKPGVNPQSLVDHPSLETITRTEDLNVLVRHNRSSGTPYALVRGSAYQEEKIREAVKALQELVFLQGTPVVCSLSMEILQQQQEAVRGPNNNNIRVITQRTGAQIHYPNKSGATTFYIQGSLESILAARKYLLGCLPVFLMFELRGETELPYNLEAIGNDYNVAVSVKQKQRGSDSKSVVIRSLESNLTNVYEVRRKLMGPAHDNGLSLFCNDYSFMTDLCCPQAAQQASIMSRFGGLSVNTMMQFPPVSGHHPMMISPLSPFPNFPFMAPNGYMYDMSAYGNGGMNGTMEAMTPVDSSRPSESSSAGVGGPNDDQARDDDDDDQEPQIIISTQQPFMPKVQPSYPPTKLPVESLPGTPNDPLPGRSDIGEVLYNSAQKFSAGKKLPLSRELFEERERSEWKAPGAERNTPKNDYEQRRLKASRVMQQRPSGVRMPNSSWSAMGFSKTMNDSMLRQVLPAAAKEEETDEAAGSNNATLLTTPGKLKDIAENEILGDLGPWPPGVNASPLYNRKNLTPFMQTMHFDTSILPGDKQAELEECIQRGDLPGILTYLKFGQYIDLFQDQEIDFDTFLTLDEEDLKAIGLNTVGARRKIRTLIDMILASRGFSL